MHLWVDAQSSGSFSAIFTFLTNPYKIFLNDSNGYGCYFFKYYYSNLWIIHVQSPTNLPKFMWKLVFNVNDVILKFESLKRKTYKIHKNNASSKTFKKYVFEIFFFKRKNCNSYELMKIWSDFNHSKVPSY